MPPKVSVVVVCWNAAATLETCLRHLLAQDYPSYEIIVVDDGSTDGTVEVARRHLGEGEVTIVVSPLNRGCPHARNLGMRRATGEVIAFVDADGFVARDWLTQLVIPFNDPSVGAVASTVFLSANPRVLNGSGGRLTRRRRGVDLNFGEPLDVAQFDDEVLYPMGCGMAIRRATADKVGSFDDRVLNYYDDVDYGIRVWRAGYRVVVAHRAWIDHEFNAALSNEKILLCEQHRMRLVLKHAPLSEVARSVLYEAADLALAGSPRHELLRAAVRWNARHAGSAIIDRIRASASPRVPDAVWGPISDRHVPPPMVPDPGAASAQVDMSKESSIGSLVWGWFYQERMEGCEFRWSGPTAGLLIHLERQISELYIRYQMPPRCPAGVTLEIYPRDSLTPASTLDLRPSSRWLEVRYPLTLPAGDYEVRFRSDAPSKPSVRDRRSLGIALSKLSFNTTATPLADHLDMDSMSVDRQLSFGWHGPERFQSLSYRWAGSQAGAFVRVQERAQAMRLVYRLPPSPVEPVQLRLRAVGAPRDAWTAFVPWRGGAWHRVHWDLSLPPADYELRLDASRTWSRRRDRRELSLALSSLSFVPPAGR